MLVMSDAYPSPPLPKLDPKNNIRTNPFENTHHDRSETPTIFPKPISPNTANKSLTTIKGSLEISQNASSLASPGILDSTLPEGWSRLLDSKTGMPYYSNHWTQTTTWTDPRTIVPIPIQSYTWPQLPDGWEVLTDAGRRYFLNHDTQTSSWSSPCDNRTRHLFAKLYHFYTHIETQMTDKRESIKESRKYLMSELSSFRKGKVSEEEIFSVNDHLEKEKQEVNNQTEKLHCLQNLIELSATLLNGELDYTNFCFQVCNELKDSYETAKSLYSNQTKLITSLINTIGLRLNCYLPSDPQELPENAKDNYIHMLPDLLTPKTPVELKLESKLLTDYIMNTEIQINTIISMTDYYAMELSSAEPALMEIGISYIEKQLLTLKLQPKYLQIQSARFEEHLENLIL